MLGWFKQKQKTSPLLLPLQFSNLEFARVVRETTINEPPNAGCMVIAAYSVLGTSIAVANNPALKGEALPRTVDEFISFIAESVEQTEGEAEKRRLLWLYQSALIRRLTFLSSADPVLLDTAASIWVYLARSSTFLRPALAKNVLWSSEEKEFLDTIDSEKDGYSYVLQFLAPSHIRAHSHVQEFARGHELFWMR